VASGFSRKIDQRPPEGRRPCGVEFLPACSWLGP
jgi:hypothetical protein